MYVRVVCIQCTHLGMMGVCLSTCKPTVRKKVPIVAFYENNSFKINNLLTNMTYKWYN